MSDDQRSAASVRFLKGHGTQNDFVIIPDLDGCLDLSPDHVARLCDRRAGIGGDGLLRVVHSAVHDEARGMAAEAEWFMDYRNADGGVAEMCGNGVRVFVRYLVHAGLVEPGDLAVATRAGVRHVHVSKDSPEGIPSEITVDMGRALFPERGLVEVAVPGRRWPAHEVSMGNPHAVVFVDDLCQAGDLCVAPLVSPESAYPEGVNVEFVVDLGPRHVALRVHERGVGETRSCGTGACAVMVAAARRDGLDPAVTGVPATYTVDVPGGRLVITERVDGGIEMTGPAVIVAEGTLNTSWWRPYGE